MFQQCKSIDQRCLFANQGLKLINVISNYSRTHLPTTEEIINVRLLCNYEIEDFLEAFPSSCKRLPFQMMCTDTWSILENELSIYTLDSLLPLCEIVSIDENLLFAGVIRKVSNGYFIVEDVKELILRIADKKTAILNAISCAKKLEGKERCDAYALAISITYELPVINNMYPIY